MYIVKSTILFILIFIMKNKTRNPYTVGRTPDGHYANIRYTSNLLRIKIYYVYWLFENQVL